MRVLVYKRTHLGDPGDGVFGSSDCMGRVRGLKFDAVIGVGGLHPDRGYQAMARRVTWVGVGPTKTPGPPRGPFVTFDFFRDFGLGTEMLAQRAPHLAEALFVRRARYVVTRPGSVLAREALAILEAAREGDGQEAPAISGALPAGRRRKPVAAKCPPRTARKQPTRAPPTCR